MARALPSIRSFRCIAAGLLGWAAIACAPGPWEVDRLERAHPDLAAVSQHRLADVTPYLLPARGRVVFFLCRWPVDVPIPVSLPPDATSEERGDLDRVLRAWEGAGLGVSFSTGAPPGVGIEVRFVESEAGASQTVYAANTVADCAVAAEALEADAGDVLPAQLVFASIHLWRGGFDDLGRPKPHTREEFVGSALHEFGHALGYQGHADLGRTVMVKETDAARRAARRLLAGGPFADHTLRALYAVPSGSVIERSDVPGVRTRSVDRLAGVAREHGLVGPYARVGDRDAFLDWRSPTGARYVLRIPDVRKLLRSPEGLWIRPSAAAAELLDPS